MVPTSTYIEEIDGLKRLLDRSAFRVAVQLFAVTAENFLAALKEVGVQNSPNRKVSVRKAVKHVSTQVNVYEVHDSSVAVQRAIENLPMVDGDVSSQILDGIAAFKSAYRRFLDAQDDDSAAELSWVSLKLNEKLTAIEGVWDHLLVSLTPTESRVPSGYEVVDIRGGGELSLTQFSKALTLLAGIYSKACDLVGVDPREHPLIIVKIESGSLLAKLAGHLNAIGATKIALAISALESFRSQFAASGRLNAQTKQAMQVLELRDALHRAGVPVAIMDAELQQIGADIARNSRKFIASFDDVSIDGEVVSESVSGAIGGPKGTPLQIGHDRDSEAEGVE